MSAPSFKLKPNANSRVLTGHPWVFANEVEALLPPECDGEVVECRDRMGRMLGVGICNGKSQIVWRRLSTACAKMLSSPVCGSAMQATLKLPAMVTGHFPTC